MKKVNEVPTILKAVGCYIVSLKMGKNNPEKYTANKSSESELKPLSFVYSFSLEMYHKVSSYFAYGSKLWSSVYFTERKFPYIRGGNVSSFRGFYNKTKFMTVLGISLRFVQDLRHKNTKCNSNMISILYKDLSVNRHRTLQWLCNSINVILY